MAAVGKRVSLGVLVSGVVAGAGIWIGCIALATNHQTASSPLVKNVIFSLRHNDTVKSILGNNIQPGYWFYGSINQYKGVASLDFTLQGEKDAGSCHLEARRRGFDWEMREITLRPRHDHAVVDLSTNFTASIDH